MAAIAYYVLAADDHRVARARTRSCGRPSVGDWKGKLSPVLYVAAIPLAFVLALDRRRRIYVLVALIWLVPDRRIEKALARREAR